MDRSIDARDAGLRRLRRTTAVTVLFCGALALGVADLAAKALPGRSSKRSTATVRRPARQSTRETPPPLVAAGNPASSAPSPPASAPAPASAPPVVSSGGS